ncbi:hypothetical protein [Bythopirellula goksoeyrii]|uniref:Uncharacterized protein n=1 Tax=Bythopirellula goksoeyrii TaxID=1400387 RepID=A0A5B9Q5Y8_9BACT|nr:hypothetical protein [Bythopirellula goksoeyrii]QEG33109.1 hypothetical protein Pr1d_03700 [Bythopirellula goksoeyrii]
MNRILSISVCAAIVLFGLATAAISQNANSRRPSGTNQASSATTINTAAEREKIWNSPTMLKARAWVQEYCQRSAKITPAEAKQYMTELENLSPVQMKLWLLKFDHQEEMNRKREEDFEIARRAHLKQAEAINNATQKSYADINRDENEAASTEERSLQIQAQNDAERGLAKQEETSLDASNVDSFYNGYGGLYGDYGYGFSYRPLDGIGVAPHIHIHVHPPVDAD